MEYNSAIINGEDSQTSKEDSETEYFQTFLHARAVHALYLYRINYELQAEMLSLIEGYRELVRLDSSLIPLESSCFREDDEIVGITMDMIQKNVSWHDNQSALTIRNLANLQSHLLEN